MVLASRRVDRVRKLSLKPLQCVLTEEDSRRIVVVKNGKDSLDTCRVVNGMWQTSGGWGKIDRDSAAEAMLKYADAAYLMPIQIGRITSFVTKSLCYMLQACK